MSDPIDEVVDIVDDAATGVAEAVDTATDAVTGVLEDTIRQLTDTLRLTSEGHTASLAGISDRLARIESQFLAAAESAIEDAAAVAEEVVDTAAAVPAAATGEVEAVIESADDPPIVKRRGMIGAMKKGGRKR